MQDKLINKRIVIYDGVCIFCNGAVNFIIQRDSAARFIFAPMQSEIAQDLITSHEISNVGIDTFLLIKDGRSYIWTNAAIEIAVELDGFWYLFKFFRLVPRPVRDFLYRMFARNRYKLFGQSEQCLIPNKATINRFVGL